MDILQLGDGVAMQERLMMSRKMWGQWFRPRLERVIRAAKDVKPDILIWYHSDGKINDLVPDLIRAGVDILNQVQLECLDHQWIKQEFGSQIAFSGGLGVQSVLPFDTPEEVREHVRCTIQSACKVDALRYLSYAIASIRQMEVETRSSLSDAN